MKINIKPLKLSTSFKTEKIYPELENLEIMPTKEEQIFKSEMYGYDKIKVSGVTADIDENIKPEHIKSGVVILDIEGNFEGVNTSDATVIASDVLEGKTVYINNQKVEGTLPNNGGLEYEPSDKEQPIPQGYTSGGVVKAINSEELVIEPSTEVQVKEGLYKKVTVGATLDTSDATATAGDIVKDKTAYVNGEKVTGTLESSGYNCKVDNITDNTITSNSFKYYVTYVDFKNIKLKGWNCYQMFSMFSSLKTLKNLDTSNIENMQAMFEYCNALEDLEVLNTTLVTNMSSMFSMCSKLTDKSLNNILEMCINANKIKSSNKRLSYLGLTSTQATRCQSLSNYQAFLNAGWTTGY